MSEPTTDGSQPMPANNNKAWPIAFGVAVVLLVVAVLLLILRWNGTDETSSVGTSGTSTSTTASGSTSMMSTTTTGATSTTTKTTSTSTATSTATATVTVTTTTRESGPSSSDSKPVDLECSPSILRSVIDPNVIASDATVTAFGCTPSTAGDVHDAYAWARLSAPNVNDIVVLYTGYVGTEPTTPMPVEWTVLTYGSDISCQKFIPVASCDMLPGVPR